MLSTAATSSSAKQRITCRASKPDVSFAKSHMALENLAGRSIAGYRLLERVGEGGTAEVYRADHPERGACAFKVLRERLRSDPTVVKRFLREAGYGSRVVHPGVVRTYDFGEADGLDYLALEWANGEPLADFLHREGPLAPADAVALVRQLADALAAAHAAGIIHRDLKPENIMYDPRTRTVKLLDFGIARDAEEPAAERLTRTGFFVGTLQYVAPEALSGQLVDGRADIYSLAKITYYMLTGRHPHDGRSPRELFQQLLNGKPTPLSQASDQKFPAALEAAVMKGLARQPDDRQPTVTAFADELEAGLAKSKDAGRSRGFLGALKNIVNKRQRE
jgi:serine/threonine-protein kinase